MSRFAGLATFSRPDLERDGRAQSGAWQVQLRSQLAGLSYQEQLALVRPAAAPEPAPTGAGANVQLKRGKKQKPLKLSQEQKETARGVEEEVETTGTTEAQVPIKAAICVKTNTKKRGARSLGEFFKSLCGHAWVEISMGPDVKSVFDLGEDWVQAGRAFPTVLMLLMGGKTSLGFWPGDQSGGIGWKDAVKQIFEKNAGSVEVPDPKQGEETARKAYFLTDPGQLKAMLQYAMAAKGKPYESLGYNCTAFAAEMMGAAGFGDVGSLAGQLNHPSPNKLYKRLFTRAHTGDKTVSVQDVRHEGSDHLSKKGWKALRSKQKKKGLERTRGGVENEEGLGRTQEQVEEAIEQAVNGEEVEGGNTETETPTEAPGTDKLYKPDDPVALRALLEQLFQLTPIVVPVRGANGISMFNREEDPEDGVEGEVVNTGRALRFVEFRGAEWVILFNGSTYLAVQDFNVGDALGLEILNGAPA